MTDDQNPIWIRFNFLLFFYLVQLDVLLVTGQFACVSVWVYMLVLYVQVCMFVCLHTAVCFFPQSASVVAFLALNAGSPPPAACDIGSWHPHVYSECRRMLPPLETFVLSRRGGVCPSKPLGKLSTTPVKRLQTTLKTAPSTTDVCFASTLVSCAWSIRIESLWRMLYTWVTLLCRLCLVNYI